MGERMLVSPEKQKAVLDTIAVAGEILESGKWENPELETTVADAFCRATNIPVGNRGFGEKDGNFKMYHTGDFAAGENTPRSYVIVSLSLIEGGVSFTIKHTPVIGDEPQTLMYHIFPPFDEQPEQEIMDIGFAYIPQPLDHEPIINTTYPQNLYQKLMQSVAPLK